MHAIGGYRHHDIDPWHATPFVHSGAHTHGENGEMQTGSFNKQSHHVRAIYRCRPTHTTCAQRPSPEGCGSVPRALAVI